MALILDRVSHAQKMNISVTFLIDINGIRVFSVIRVIQIQVELIVSGQIERKQIRYTGVISVDQSSVRFSIACLPISPPLLRRRE